MIPKKIKEIDSINLNVMRPTKVIESKWCKKWLRSIKPGSFKSTTVSMLQSGERQKQQKEWNGEQKCYILTWHFQGK